MSAKMSGSTNALNWFEIPAKDIVRASKFYEKIFEVSLYQAEMMQMKMAMFPTEAAGGKVGGALVQSSMHHPAPGGCFVYLNANPDLQQVLNRVETAGGKITMPKTLINKDTGYMAFFTDSEGNSVGLHSNA